MPSELRYRWRLQMQVLTTSSPSRIIKCRSGYSSEPIRRSEDANGNRAMTIYRLAARLQTLSTLLRSTGFECAQNAYSSPDWGLNG